MSTNVNSNRPRIHRDNSTPTAIKTPKTNMPVCAPHNSSAAVINNGGVESIAYAFLLPPSPASTTPVRSVGIR